VKNIKGLLLTLASTLIIMLVGMSLYEFTKQMVFPGIAIWESHIMTVVFSSIVATTASFFVFKNRQKIVDRCNVENNERKIAQESLAKALDEKNLLIREINHRVKNNFQLVSSIIGIEKSRITDGSVLVYLDALQNRIRTMAQIHINLQESDEISVIEFGSFIDNIAKNLYEIYVTDPTKIKLEINAEKVHLEIKQAIPLGLILNELLTNSFKYAFNVDKSGYILIVTFKRIGNGMIELTVSDNGTGISSDLEKISGDSLGIRIVKNLTKDQLNGKIQLVSEGGTKFIITFESGRISNSSRTI
jgi:two-component system, sensor histidine kinase PdtaS